jgi:NADPH-dependent ferric siderophore reductase
VKGGEAILVGGPEQAKHLPKGADRYVVAGDMTALPAISVDLEKLSHEARGVVATEIQHEDDQQEFAASPGIETHWLINARPGTQPDLLADHLRSLRRGSWDTKWR